ncbi:MAG TPA: PIN domain-containing protein [Anaeromyxobacteraceae bacterium]|nr:PIN domain-containing protein [Anaeromyxobacteraceae bacterium]
MGLLIDSSVLIAAERGTLDLHEKLGKELENPVALAAISASELLHGVHRTTSVNQRARRQAFVEQLLSALPVIPFDLVAARLHAELWARLAAKGIQVGAHDLLIAATAIAAGYGVATRDERSFPRIPGLTTAIW